MQTESQNKDLSLTNKNRTILFRNERTHLKGNADRPYGRIASRHGSGSGSGSGRISDGEKEAHLVVVVVSAKL